MSSPTESSSALRADLRARAEAWAESQRLPHFKSLGKTPTVLFETAADGSLHGNFHPLAWRAIQSDPTWTKRLGKRHSQIKTLPVERRKTARELDSSNSSDTLLMNCFCFPGAAERILAGLGLPAVAGVPEFGYHPRLQLSSGGEDATEVDMRLGSVLVEAKLTERSFTSSPRTHVSRYRQLTEVFDVDSLPGNETHFFSYQLIRNTLAAAHVGAHFLVLIDARRPDLRQEWGTVGGAIRDKSLAARCVLRTWQQVAAAAPQELRVFLEQKYGIVGAP